MPVKHLLESLSIQKQKLIAQNPNLQYYFLNIFVPQWNTYIPFLPIRCFRDFDLNSNSISPDTQKQQTFFFSSGSAGHTRAQHRFSPSGRKLIEIKTSEGFGQFLDRQGLSRHTPVVSLIPRTSRWPTSSLATMLEMFSAQNFNIIWCDIDADPRQFLTLMSSFAAGTEVLVFGTTFHHVQLARFFAREPIAEQLKHLRICVMDTGGTKGRTEAFTLKDTISLMKSFYAQKDLRFFSEYGMCELGSQAWSLRDVHDGSFVANSTLIPLAIDLCAQEVLGANKTGFLGFIDAVNTESWGAILTEDMGLTLDDFNADTIPCTFELHGRGPDATLKGCSLNVLPHFSFEAEEAPLAPSSPDSESSSRGLTAGTITLPHLLTHLKNKGWAPHSLHDVEHAFASLENFSLNSCPTELSIPALQNKKVLIISAANTPIAWVYPFLVCAVNGAQSVTLKVPSLRLDDHLSPLIRQQTLDLIEYFSVISPHTTLTMSPLRSLAHTFSQYDFVLTFGTSETVSSLGAQCPTNTTRFIGFGDVKNAKHAARNTPLAQLANECSIWNGRGCLTPVCYFVEEGWSTEQAHCFCQELNALLTPRFSALPEHVQKAFHAHNTAYVRAQIAQVGLNPNEHVARESMATIVNLSGVSAETLKRMPLDFNFGGCGFVYLLPMEVSALFPTLNFFVTNPSLYETHMGQTWQEHFNYETK